MPELKLTRIFDLIGVSIEGRQADQRSRNADGACMHQHCEAEGPRMVKMKSVALERDKHGEWMRWEWDGRGLPLPYSCGFSGVLTDGVKEREYFILIEQEGTAHA